MADALRLTEKEVGVIYGRIERARKFAKDRWLPHCERARKLYDGQHWEDMHLPSERARIVVNYCRQTVETKVANIAFNYPDFHLRPLNTMGQAHANVATHLLQYDWRQADGQREAKRALRDKGIYGLGVVMTGWLYEPDTSPGEASVPVEGGRPAEAVEASDTTPDSAPSTPMGGSSLLSEGIPEDGSPPLLEMNSSEFPNSSFAPAPMRPPRADRPFAKRISPCAFFVSPECDAVLENAEYCGYVELRALDEVKADKRYSNTRQLAGNTKSLKPWMDREEMSGQEKAFGDYTMSDSKRVTLFHYYERRKRLHVVMCDEHKKPLLIEPFRHEGDRYPFAVDRVSDDEDCFFPTPPLLWIEHQQREINEARTQHSEWRGQSVPKYQTRGPLDEDQKQRICSNRAGTTIENLVEPVTPIVAAPLQKEVLEAGSLALQDLQFIAGLNDYEVAQPTTKRVTTAEVQAIQQGTGSRGAADRQAFEMFCAEIATHFLELEQQYSVRSRELPIYDRDENISEFVDFTPEQIRGEFLVEVHVGSTTAPNAKGATEAIGWIMQSIPNFVNAQAAAQQLGMDLRPLLPRLLKLALPDLRDVEQLLVGQIEQSMAQPALPPGMPMAGGQPAGPEMAAAGMPGAPPESGGDASALAQLLQMGAGGGF